jgi:hypothetical protein
MIRTQQQQLARQQRHELTNLRRLGLQVHNLIWIDQQAAQAATTALRATMDRHPLTISLRAGQRLPAMPRL